MLMRLVVVLSLLASGCSLFEDRSGENFFFPLLVNDCDHELFWQASLDADIAVEKFTSPDNAFVGGFTLHGGNKTVVQASLAGLGFFLVWSLDPLDPDPAVVEIPVDFVDMEHPRVRLAEDCVTLIGLYEGEANDTDGRKWGDQK